MKITIKTNDLRDLLILKNKETSNGTMFYLMDTGKDQIIIKSVQEEIKATYFINKKGLHYEIDLNTLNRIYKAS